MGSTWDFSKELDCVGGAVSSRLGRIKHVQVHLSSQGYGSSSIHVWM